MDWQEISKTFWSPSFWLVPNTTWADITYEHTNHEDLLWPIPVAIAVLIIRSFILKYIFPWLGRALGVKSASCKEITPNAVLDAAYNKCHRINQQTMIGLLKQVDMNERGIERWWRKRRVQDKPSIQDKFGQSLWRFFQYVASVAFGLFVLWDKPWLWDVKQCWYGYPAHSSLSHEIKLFCLFSITVNWTQFVSHLLDTKRKDFWLLFIHHIIALVLLNMSWICNFHRAASLVVVTLDFAECFLEAAKMAKYTNHHRLCNGIFVIFLFAWFPTRFGFYLRIIYSAIFDIPNHFSTFPAYYALCSMLMMVLCISMVWNHMVMKIAYNSCKSGQVERDCRSSSSELQSDSDPEHMVSVAVRPHYGQQRSYERANKNYMN